MCTKYVRDYMHEWKGKQKNETGNNVMKMNKVRAKDKSDLYLATTYQLFNLS